MLTKIQQMEIAEVKKHIEAAIRASLPNALQRPLLIKVMASTVTHTPLQPTGDQYDIRFKVQVLEKPAVQKEEQADE